MTMVSSCDKVMNNSDLVTSILLRLSAKDVTRCKCVSKQWRDLISTPWFCHSHTHISAPSSLWVCNNHIFSFTQNSEVRLAMNTSIDDMRRRIEIMQSCHGLLLCKSILWLGKRARLRCSYLVKNPITEKYIKLHFPPKSTYHEIPSEKIIYEDDEQISALYLVFDPLRSLYFKVISFVKVESCDNLRFKIFVYLSETNSWDKGDVFFTAPSGMKVDSGVYCNGSVHWYNPGEVSMYFDVYEQCFKPLPEPTFSDACIVKYFGECKGKLHSVLTKGDNKLDFDVFKLKEDYSSWVLIYHVDLNLARDEFFIRFPYHVVCVVLEGNEEDWMIVFFVGSKMVSYNLKDHASGVVHEVGFMNETWVRK